MNTREIANEYRLSHWTQLLCERATDETIDAFCKRTAITRAQYFYWQRKLRAAACKELITQSEVAPPAPSGWSLCELSTPKLTDNALYVEIGKCRIQVNSDTDSELLAKTCKVLAELC